MRRLNIMPDVNIFNSLIQVCTRCKDFKRSLRVLELMDLFGVRPDAFIYTSLIDVCSKVCALAFFMMLFVERSAVRPANQN